ncbi:hypothetical protein EC957_005181 [Mortierella hygrophila]|uniref:Uncharacterized protein n=1 Tax=Mortierella hygrophila TaxID=979708 RepID=A0A9P6JZR6_9FUNG|nr:hypothetical protein EC957_005181 [Mortierella hygrophila]
MRSKYSADALRYLKRHIHRVREVKVQAKALVFPVNSMIRRPHHPYDQTTTTTYSAHSTTSGTASDPISLFSPDPSVLPQMSRLASIDHNTDDLAKGGQYFLKVEYSEYKAMPRLAWFLQSHMALTSVHLNVSNIKSFVYAHMLIQPISSLTSLKELDLNFRMPPLSWVSFVQSVFNRLPVSIEWVLSNFDPIAGAVAKNRLHLRSLDNCCLAAVHIVGVLRPHTLTNLRNNEDCLASAVNSILRKVSTNHYRSVTEIRIEKSPHVGGSVVQAILWNCTALQHLLIRGDPPISTRLKHLVEDEWVCRGLRNLEITVELRQVITSAVDMSEVPGVHEPTWIILEKFYRQLGALSEIEVLNLGIKSKEMQWLETSSRPRITAGRRPQAQLGQDDSNEKDDDDNRSADEDDIDPSKLNFKALRANSADASFPALLYLGKGMSEVREMRGYLSWPGGLRNLRELRGHVQAMTTETSMTVGQ